MKVMSKRRKKNELINYNRLIVAVEGIITTKQAILQCGGTYFEKIDIAQDIKFWKGRLSELRDKAVNGG